MGAINKKIILFNFLMAIGLFAAILTIISGCSKDPTPEEAQHFFNEHKVDLNNIISMIKMCGGTRVINAFGNSLNKYSESQCSNKDITYRNAIAKKLKKLRILWVIVDWNKSHELDGISFVLSSHGIVGSGGGSAIWYFTKPLRKHENFNAGPNYPLTAYPCQWFYVISE